MSSGSVPPPNCIPKPNPNVQGSYRTSCVVFHDFPGCSVVCFHDFPGRYTACRSTSFFNTSMLPLWPAANWLQTAYAHTGSTSLIIREIWTHWQFSREWLIDRSPTTKAALITQNSNHMPYLTVVETFFLNSWSGSAPKSNGSLLLRHPTSQKHSITSSHLIDKFLSYGQNSHSNNSFIKCLYLRCGPDYHQNLTK